jgi:HTH-type transcriptional regulator/antitoxin PezA
VREFRSGGRDPPERERSAEHIRIPAAPRGLASPYTLIARCICPELLKIYHMIVIIQSYECYFYSCDCSSPINYEVFMTVEITADEIKETRERYGLTQRSFATLLGIGEASMVRYEKGGTPSKANANLLLAARDPRFMKGCLEREGQAIPEAQRAKASGVIYQAIKLDDDADEPLDAMSEVYQYTIRQEVLNEKAANILGMLFALRLKRGTLDNQDDVLTILERQIAMIKPSIFDEANRTKEALARIDGYLSCANDLVKRVESECGMR